MIKSNLFIIIFQKIKMDTTKRNQKELKNFIENIQFFDMHSHMAGFDLGSPADDKKPVTLYEILTNDYLAYISGSCIDKPVVPAKMEDKKNLSYDDIKDLLHRCQALSTYCVMREGIRMLHPFKESDINEKNWNKINKSIIEAYSKYGERKWQRLVCKKVGVFKQVHISTLPYVTIHFDSLGHEEKYEQLKLLAPSLVLDGYVFSGFKVYQDAREMSYKIIGKKSETLDEYLMFCDKVLDLFKMKGGKSVKLLISYHRTLKIENIEKKRTEQLFRIGYQNLSKKALHTLQDFLLKKILIMAKDKSLPLIVHTGYSNPTTYGDPENLETLFQDPQLKGLKVSICHSGWPNEGKAIIMARTYRNCYFDLSWTPLLSETLGFRILSEVIDMVPLNKILIGTDCGTAECFAGTVKLIRRTLFNVLNEKMQKKMFDLKTAKYIAKAILYENPLEFHNITEMEEKTCNLK